MKFKTKDTFNVSASKLNNSVEKQLKVKRKSGTKFSPEENLGLELEKLIEKGVKVKKMDNASPEKLDISSTVKRVQTPQGQNRGTPVKFLTSSAGNSPKNNNRATNSPGVNLKKSSPVMVIEAKSTHTPMNGKSKSRNISLKKGIGEISDSPDSVEKTKQQSSSNRLILSKVVKAVQACLDNSKEKKSNKLLDEPEPLYIQITVVKKAITPKHTCRFALRHSFVNDDSDVCFIVRDEKGQDKDITTENYRQLLLKNDITNVKKIITFSQLMDECNTHELRRKLCNAHDFFIIDSRLSGFVARHLGKQFISARKLPISINVRDKNFKKSVLKAYHKTSMKVTSYQDMFSCIVGNRSFSANQIAENVVEMATSINPDTFPGGWENIRSVSVKTSSGPKFPIYYSAVLPDSVQTPVLPPKRPKASVPVTGELSTANDATVKVEPDGTVTILKKRKPRKSRKKQGAATSNTEQNISPENADDDDENDNDESENEDESQPDDDDDTSDFDISDDEPTAIISKTKTPPLIVRGGRQVKQESLSNADDDSDDDEEEDDSDNEEDAESDDSDDDIEAKAEQDYLKEINVLSAADNDEDDDSDEEEDSDDDDDDDDDDDEEEEDSDEEETQAKNIFKPQPSKTPGILNNKNNSPNQQLNKRKFSMENNKGAPIKKTKSDNIVSQNKSLIDDKQKGIFDTTLGETWAIKKKQPVNQQGFNNNQQKKKNNKKANKVNKHQRKAKIKMNKAKKGRN